MDDPLAPLKCIIAVLNADVALLAAGVVPITTGEQGANRLMPSLELLPVDDPLTESTTDSEYFERQIQIDVYASGLTQCGSYLQMVRRALQNAAEGGRLRIGSGDGNLLSVLPQGGQRWVRDDRNVWHGMQFYTMRHRMDRITAGG